MQVSSHRVVNIKSPSAAADRAVLALALANKNLRNAELFLVRNAVTAFEWSREQGAYVQMTQLHEHQLAALQAFNAAIAEVSAERVTKGRTTFESLGAVTSTRALNRAMTNQTILSRAVVLHQADHNSPDFTALPSAFAHPVSQYVATIVGQAISARVRFFQLQAASKLPSKLGLPTLPAYFGKNERCSFYLDANYLSTSFGLPKLSSAKHSLRTSFGGPELDEAAILAWNELKLGTLIEVEGQKLFQRGNGRRARPQHAIFRQLRFAVKGGAVRWQLVFELQNHLPSTTPLGRFRKAYVEAGHAKAFDKRAPAEQDELLRDYVQTHHDQFQRIAGLDLGIVNHATLGTSAGRHLVFSGRAMNAKLSRLSLRLDHIQADLHARMLPPALRATLEANRAEPDKERRTSFLRKTSAHLGKCNQPFNATRNTSRAWTGFDVLSPTIFISCPRRSSTSAVVYGFKCSPSAETRDGKMK
jgi:hypothetical protein